MRPLLSAASRAVQVRFSDQTRQPHCAATRDLATIIFSQRCPVLRLTRARPRASTGARVQRYSHAANRARSEPEKLVDFGEAVEAKEMVDVVFVLNACPIFSKNRRDPFGVLERFVEGNGHGRVPSSYTVDGHWLGTWVVFRRVEHDRGTLGADRGRRLRELPGWTWDPRADDWEESFRRLIRITGSLLGSLVLHGVRVERQTRPRHGSGERIRQCRRSPQSSIWYTWPPTSRLSCSAARYAARPRIAA